MQSKQHFKFVLDFLLKFAAMITIAVVAVAATIALSSAVPMLLATIAFPFVWGNAPVATPRQLPPRHRATRSDIPVGIYGGTKVNYHSRAMSESGIAFSAGGAAAGGQRVHGRSYAARGASAHSLFQGIVPPRKENKIHERQSPNHARVHGRR